jgi:CubicO group peptidase (beta-lactamase class C family)
MKRWRIEDFRCRRGAAAVLALLVLAVAVGRTDAGRAEPSLAPPAVFSQAGLQRVGAYLDNEIAAERIPGAVLLIQQHGHPVYLHSFGMRDVANRTPMTADSIFRLYSMSKPVTSVAAMMLIEDGKLKLSDPLAKYIPDFADVKVDVERPAENGQQIDVLEPARHPITIEDLLRHTSGITYGFYGDSPVKKLYAHSNLLDGDFDNAAFAARLAKLPLAEQPGTRWDYGHSTDVLGRVIEVVSGQSLFEFGRERLLDPLGMRDTAFSVPDPVQRPRIAEPLPSDWFSRPIAGLSDPTVPRRWQSGGAGMVGTISDYARFAQMLLNGGTLDGRRYLKPQTIALMTSDHIGPATNIIRDQSYFPGADSGFGLGFAVRTQLENALLPVGEYRWDGIGGTFFFVDPRDDMFTICMMQSPSQRVRIETELKTLVYEALER